jgi:hypothetical protein
MNTTKLLPTAVTTLVAIQLGGHRFRRRCAEGKERTEYIVWSDKANRCWALECLLRRHWSHRWSSRYSSARLAV